MGLSTKLIPGCFLLQVLAAGLPLPAPAVTLVMDYSYDVSGYFPADGQARATLEQAAADLSAVLADGQLGALPSNSFSGTNGSTTAVTLWSLGFTNPSTGDSVSLTSPHTVPGLNADEIRIFAGWRNLPGNTLGQGGPGIAQGTLGPGSGGSPGQWVGAMAAMETAAEAALSRGGGPIINNASGNTSLGAVSASYSVGFGSLIGNLWFDSDSDNNSVPDTQTELDAAWNLGLGPPAGSQRDFYSVALHELMHAVGFGVSLSWTNLPADGVKDGGHLEAGTQGISLATGALQDALMTPSLTLGSRKTLTSVDVEYLGAIGWNVVPEPGVPVLLSLLAGFGLVRRKRAEA